MEADCVQNGNATKSLAQCGLLARLHHVPITRCEHTAARLEQRDLVTLVRFASPPHVLIHHVVAALQTVLLSLSLLHQPTSGFLRIPPWPLLRLDVLTNIDVIWRKMETKLARLRRPAIDPRRKPLAHIQVRFVVDAVLMLPLLSTLESWDEALNAVGRICGMAESVAAYVLLCVHYSLVPPLTTTVPWSILSLSPIRLHTVEPLIPSPRAATTTGETTVRSWRCGLKHRGRYFLYRAKVGGSTYCVSGHLSALAMDCRHTAFEWEDTVSAASAASVAHDEHRIRHREKPNHTYAGSWSKKVPMPMSILRLLTEYLGKARSLSSATILHLLLQTSAALKLFKSPPLGLMSPLRGLPCITANAEVDLHVSIHVLIFTVETELATNDTNLELVGIGAIEARGLNTPLSDLRKHFVAYDPCSLGHLHLSSSSFRFFVDGILVPTEDEPWRRAVELLPCAVVCLDAPAPRRQHKASQKQWRLWVSILSTLSRAVGSALAKQLTQQPQAAPVALASPLAISLYSLNQTVASSASSSSIPSPHSSSVLSAIDTLLALFVDWKAFVQFQQLQDATAILLARGSPLKPRIAHANQAESIASDYPVEEALRPTPTAAELEVLALPYRPFHPETEYLRPLYATFTVPSRSKAYLCSPYPTEVLAALSLASTTSPMRLAVENPECVLHVSKVSLTNDKRVVVRFARDRSCPLEVMMTMRGAFVWSITPLVDQSVEPLESTVPPRWLRDVFRCVTHPTWDFREQMKKCTPSTWPFASRFFHVDVPYSLLEDIVEATHWSRDVDWSPHWHGCDVESEFLRPKYDALRLSYPSGFAIDSVKFSKFLRECGLQPTYLTVGDAAFLFTSHRAPGSHYEMIYDGFVDAMRWIAGRVLRTRQERDAPQQLRALCFEWLLQAPSMEAIWQRVINQWRLAQKLQCMKQAAIEYCAATRIRANWKRLLIRRVLIAQLTRLKNERRAAAKLQSVYKMRKVRKVFVQLKTTAMQIQRFIKSRRLVRRLRLERAQRVEIMRLRLQRWMRARLRILRCWKKINAAWLARRARILAKRDRLVCAGAYQIASRLYRASLYRWSSLPSPLPSSSLSSTSLTTTDLQVVEPGYEFELLDPITNWCRSIRVDQRTLDVLEHDAETILSATKPADVRQLNRWQLWVLVQRLHLKIRRPNVRIESPSWSDPVFRLYRDAVETSLGRLVYQGHVRVQTFSPSTASPTFRFVRVHLHAHAFTLVAYAPASSAKTRFTFTTSFAYQLVTLAGLQGEPGEVDGCRDSKTADEMIARSIVINTFGGSRPHKLRGIRFLLGYLMHYGTTPPTRDMMPKAIERRERDQRERDARAYHAQQQRELALVLLVQTMVRRLLAIRYVQSLAQRSYTKAVDLTLHRMVYTHRRKHDVLTYLDKPHSLGDKDVVDPADVWIWNEDATALPEARYFNPRRGVFSKVDDTEAALRLQRWFRRAMWTRGFPEWNLRCLSLAMVFHQHVHIPTDVTDRRHVEPITHYAYQRHVLHHDYKAASTYYEAALKLDPDHVPALVGLAVLLIYSCRYPAKQTWARGLGLLDRARQVDPFLSTSLTQVEQNCFRYAIFLHPTSANVMGNHAVFLQCMRGDLDKAELLYRRAMDVDSTNEYILENYLRLQRERTPEGIYSTAGPSKIAVRRSLEIRRFANSDWRELEDSSARLPSAMRFFQNVQSGLCTWTSPTVE